MDLLAWWNLVFIVPFSTALLYLVVYACSGLTLGDHDLAADGELQADAELGTDADLDADADAGADADLDADVDAGTDVDAHADTHEVAGCASGGQEANGHALGHSQGTDHTVTSMGQAASAADMPFYLQALAWVGVGRVPLSIVWMVLFFLWGIIGFLTNQLVFPLVPQEWMVALISLPVAAVSSSGLTRGISRLVGRYLPTTETYALPRARLVGKTGQAVYGIDDQFGLVAVRGPQGDLYNVPCRVYRGRKPVEKGQAVLLVEYDPQQEIFFVTEDEFPV